MALARVVSTETDDLIPLIPMTYVERVRGLIGEFERELAQRPDNIYAQRCLAGWRRELAQLEKGKLYDSDDQPPL